MLTATRQRPARAVVAVHAYVAGGATGMAIVGRCAGHVCESTGVNTLRRRVQSEAGLNKKNLLIAICELLFINCYLEAGRHVGGQVLRSGTSPTPNSILTSKAKGLKRPNDK